MRILGIESSCDDTSVALLDCSARGCFVARELTASQIDIHKKYGGVVPEIAGRAHAEKIVPLIEEILRRQPHPDAIAVAAGPGLITGLIVGVEAARTLSYAWHIPLLAVNHLDGHIHSVELPTPPKRNAKKTAIKSGARKITYPALALIASGGHTELILMKKTGHHRLIGSTRDDAAGECFDKVAKLLRLPYPGGPEISRLGESGRADAVSFPRPMLRDPNFDFSFAGLKTSALYWLRDNKLSKAKKSGVTKNDFCASLEQAIVDVLVGKTVRAAEKYRPKTVILAGGVSANAKLRKTMRSELAHRTSPRTAFLTPDRAYCMDNAAMIAVAGYYAGKAKKFVKWQKIKADPNWEIG